MGISVMLFRFKLCEIKIIISFSSSAIDLPFKSKPPHVKYFNMLTGKTPVVTYLTWSVIKGP